MRLLSLILSLLYGVSPVSAQEWIEQASGISADLYGIHMVDKNFGWAVGQNGIILRTTDEGDTWTLQPSGVGVTLRNVFFIDLQRGWAVGDGGLILRTTNGSTWESLPSGKTTALYDVHFTSAQNGFAAGDDFVLLKTVNGGTTWSPVLTTPSTQFRAIYFYDDQTGWAGGGGGVLLKTTNGGQWWAQQNTRTTTEIRDLYFITPGEGFFVGAGGVIGHTVDGGLTWLLQQSGVTQTLQAIDGNGASVWAVGGSITSPGVIITTDNKGLHWRIDAIQSSALYDLQVVPTGQGWAAGRLGAILKHPGPPDTIAPYLLSGPALSNVTDSSAVIQWNTDEPATGRVDYGLTPDLGQSVIMTGFTRSQQAELRQLTELTTYYYRILATDGAGNLYTGPVLSFTTRQYIDTQPPQFAAGPDIVLYRDTTVTVAWMANEPATATVVYTGPGPVGTRVITVDSLHVSAVIQLTGLLPDALHQYTVTLRDTAGFQTVTPAIAFETLNAQDLLPAAFIQEPSPEDSTATIVRIAWQTTRPVTARMEWGADVLSNSVEVTTLDSIQRVTLTGLDPEVTYQYRLTLTTEPLVDMVDIVRSFRPLDVHRDDSPVAFVEYPVVQAVDDRRALLNWRTVGPTGGTVLVRDILSGVEVVVPLTDFLSRRHLLLSGLTPGRSYSYAISPAGARSQTGAGVAGTFTTAAAAAGPPLFLGAPEITTARTSVLFRWHTSMPVFSSVALQPLKPAVTAAGPQEYRTAVTEYIVGLSPGAAYHATLSGLGLSGQAITSNVTFTTRTAEQGAPGALEPLRLEALGGTTWLAAAEYDQPVTVRLLYTARDASGRDLPGYRRFTRDSVYTHAIRLPLVLPPGTVSIEADLRVTDMDGRTFETVQTLDVPVAATAADPLLLVRPQVRDIAAGAVEISWETDLPSNSVVSYANAGGNQLLRGESASVRKHRVIVSGLTPGQQVVYTVRSTTPSGRSTQSPEQSFTVPGAADLEPPEIIDGPEIMIIDTAGFTVHWTTANPANSAVVYRMERDSLWFEHPDAAPATSHQVRVTGLRSATRYAWFVRSTDARNLMVDNAADSAWVSTAATADGLSPHIVAGPAVTDRRTVLAVLEWRTDVPGNSHVTAISDSDTVTAAMPDAVKEHRVVVQGLTPGLVYRYTTSTVNRYGAASAVISDEPAAAQTGGAFNPHISGGPVVSVRGTSTVIQWETNRPADGTVAYGTARTALTGTAGETAFSLKHAVTLQGLLPETLYYYTVRSQDLSGAMTLPLPQALYFRTTLAGDTAAVPVLLQGPAVETTGTGASIAWVTDIPSSSTVWYRAQGVTLPFTVRSGGVPTTRHRIALSGLTPGARYVYAVQSKVPNGSPLTAPAVFAAHAMTEHGSTPADSLLYHFIMPADPDTVPPVIVDGPVVLSRTDSSITLAWTTNEPAGTTVEYDTTGDFGRRAALPDMATNHRIVLTGLASATTFHLRAGGADIAGNGPSWSRTVTVTTIDRADREPPAITGEVRITGVGPMRATVEWHTSEPAGGTVLFSRDSTFSRGPYFRNVPPDSVFRRIFQASHAEYATEHVVILTGLTPGTRYYAVVESFDQAGNGPVRSAMLRFTTGGVTDTSGPVISGLAVRSRTDKTITLTWETDELSDTFVRFSRDSLLPLGNDGTTGGYQVEGSLELVRHHDIRVSGLLPGTLYFLQIFSSDQYGNRSLSGPVSQVRMLNVPDATPPKVPVINIVTPGDRATFLSWTSAADSSGGLTGYNVYRVSEAGFEIIAGGLTDTFYYDYGVPNDALVAYSVAAVDIHNESPPSDTVSATPGEDRIPGAPAPVDSLRAAVFTHTLRPVLMIENAAHAGPGGQYTFVVARDSLFKEVVEFTRSVPQGAGGRTGYQMKDELENDASFFWRARLEGPVFNGYWSETAAFTLAVAELGKPVAYDIQTADNKVALNWEPGPGSHGNIYIVLRGRDPRTIVEEISPVLNIPGSDGLLHFEDADVELWVTYHYKIQTTTARDDVYLSPGLRATVQGAEEFRLLQNFPNPFNNGTQIEFHLPDDSHVTLKVYNLLGQLVVTLVDTDMAGGFYTIPWDGANRHGLKVASGVYIYELTAGQYRDARKLLMLR